MMGPWIRTYSLAAAMVAGAAGVAATPARAEVVLINVFEVPAGQEEAAVAWWERARDFLVMQPGYVSTALHRARTPDARFKLVNVARWTSPEAFQAATARMRAAVGPPTVEGLRFDAALYDVVRN
jgi:heme oxygenase (mycobilin-producing)